MRVGRRRFGGVVLDFLFVVVVVNACSATVAAPGPTTSAIPSASVVQNASASPRVSLVPQIGACTGATATAEVVVRRLFDLSTAGNAAAVLDCFAEPMRSRPGFEDFAMKWASAGPATGLEIRFIDRVNGCDRLSATATLANGESVAHFGNQSTFFTLGPDRGVVRIYDAGSALTAPEYTSVSCS